MIGERLGGFEVIEEIGRGGMGVVYLARQLSLDRKAALKTLRYGAHADQAAVERFRMEARAASRITHPNLTQIYDVGVERDIYFLAMELVEGRSLLDILHAEPVMDPLRGAGIARQVALGLAALHRAGIVHRDVKPGNILIRPDGVAKLTDFGLALLRESGRRLTMDGQTVGTADYISPEQARGLEVDGRSDIYSLGVVMYQSLAGAPPFTGNTAAVLHKHIVQEPPDLRREAPAVPGLLAAVVTRCLAKDPDDRFQTAESLAAHLEDVQLEMRFASLHEPTMIVTAPDRPVGSAPERGPLGRALGSAVALFSTEARRSQAMLRTAARAEETLVNLAQARRRQSELEDKVLALRSRADRAAGSRASGTAGAEQRDSGGASAGNALDLAAAEGELEGTRREALRLQDEYGSIQARRGELVALAEQQSARTIGSPRTRTWRRLAFLAIGTAALVLGIVLASSLLRRRPGSVYLGPYPVGRGPAGITAADLNADGNLDLAVANVLDGTVTILYGAGDGTFGAQESYEAAAFDWDVLAKDFNLDGLCDLAVVSGAKPAITILYGAVREVFGAPQAFATSKGGPALATADFDGDGAPDIVAGDLSVLMGTGSGEFGRRKDFSFPPGMHVRSAATGDFNSDGWADIAVVLQALNKVEVLYGDRDGSFAARRDYSVWELPHGLAAADIDGDGTTDLAITSFVEGTASILWMSEAAPVHVRVCRDLQRPSCVRTADVDRNGLLDLVVVEEGGPCLVVALQTRRRRFKTVRFMLKPSPAGMAIGDFDDNGYPDVATTHGVADESSVYDGYAEVILNPGLGGGFTQPPPHEGGPSDGTGQSRGFFHLRLPGL